MGGDGQKTEETKTFDLNGAGGSARRRMREESLGKT